MFRWNGTLIIVLLCFLKCSNGWGLPNNRRSYTKEDEIYKTLDDNLSKYIFAERQSSNDVEVDTDELKKRLADLPKNDELFEGDMVMDNRLRDAVLGVSKKSVVIGEGIKWPNGILYYEVDPNFDPKGRELLRKTIKEFHERTCIRFEKRKDEPNYVVYTSREDVCSSNIGMIGGRQEIHIGIHCMVVGTVIHETMHALGFIHEHSRPDRDDYIDVKWENIKKDEWSNFNKYTFHDVSNEKVEYNFASVMHYRNDAFTKNGKDTLVAKGEEDLKFGQRMKFSIGDVKGINNFYNCVKYQDQPNYTNLFKDYSGQKDQRLRAAKRDKLRRLLKDRIFDLKQNNPYYQ